MKTKKIWGYVIAGVAIVAALLLLLRIDPSHSAIYPKCPVYYFTGLQCPGCGSLRAMHDLLNGRLLQAFRHNPLMVISIPYLLVGFALKIPILRSPRTDHIRGRWYGYKASIIIFWIIVAYAILRNL